ncbi:dehydrodolichyl diphosphate synthase complex subunit DHDDS [Tribolium castaneum]|uniref:Alkyl transferase n=1 Tax=Tribolium castaneum TaxID=7070 RepID=D6WVK3_TRICA|nr:PREDICTED: dehydrodolichyl diphosphate syntase complex subunit DHDDS [Tribolium castaneum]EFA08584.1 Dehydrodolichyl diphosphate synthase-like Protein [Tribolium castaneum]|eukprot:XP_972722.1 PREDICTED: dehydrodolichyl diphosphate syntase complex subunit DHDDS [Tribolium castaneum]
MSWIVSSSLTYFQRFCVNVIKCGPIPRHIAFIMDGNRRYATKTKVEKAEGHIKGFDKLAETLQWCLELGVKEVTVYAFSIENFKRSREEVDTLMKLATEKFRQLLDEKEKIMSEGVCIRIIGNLGLLSPELRKLVAEAELMTKDNNKAFLNVAFSYTSRDEIFNTVQSIVKGVQDEALDVEDIDEDLISGALYTSCSPDPDLIVRTSGEVRFSDFLLWQISNSFISFTKVLWPEFCIWHLLACIFYYQRSYNDLQQKKARVTSERAQKFLHQLQQQKITQLKSYT